MSAAPALAQPACDDSDKVRERLARGYGESPVAVGLTSLGSLVELIVSPDGGTWTLIVSTPDGQSCFLASGEGWHNLGPEPRGLAT